MLNRRHIFPALSTSLIASILVACATAPVPDTGNHITKTEWMQALLEPMSEEVCENEGPRLACYSLDTGQCQQYLRKITLDCARAYDPQIPSAMSAREMMQWGGAIGQCADNAFVQIMKSRQLSDAPECQNLPDARTESSSWS